MRQERMPSVAFSVGDIVAGSTLEMADGSEVSSVSNFEWINRDKDV